MSVVWNTHTPCPEQMTLSVVPGQVLKLKSWTGRHLWLKQIRSVPHAVPSSTYPRSVSPSIITCPPLGQTDRQTHTSKVQLISTVFDIQLVQCVCLCVYLQSSEALCWATENDVRPPCSSPNLGAGEMFEQSRYPHCTSLKHTHTQSSSHLFHKDTHTYP